MSTPSRPRWRALLVLAAAVLAVHAVLLQPGVVQVKPPAKTALRPLITRQIDPPATAIPVVTAVEMIPVALPPTRTAPSVVAAATVASQRITPAADVAALRTVASAVTPPPAGVLAQQTPNPVTLPTAAAGAMKVAIAAPVRLGYEVTAMARGLRLQGHGELRWRHDASGYEARMDISAPLLPTRRQHSVGQITRDGLAPTRFSDRARNEEAAHFERDKGKLTFSSNRPEAPLLAGAQDRLSVLLQLGAMLGGEPGRYPSGTTIAIQTVSAREAQEWHFTVEGEEDLQLPGGKVRTIRLIRQPRQEFDQKVELWLAPAMDYVPVRVRLTQPNGDSVDQQWSSTDRG